MTYLCWLYIFKMVQPTILCWIVQDEKYYLRSIGEDYRADVADIQRDFPELSSDVIFPSLFDADCFFSSVLRISSRGVQLWTHYDVCKCVTMYLQLNLGVDFVKSSWVDWKVLSRFGLLLLLECGVNLKSDFVDFKTAPSRLQADWNQNFHRQNSKIPSNPAQRVTFCSESSHFGLFTRATESYLHTNLLYQIVWSSQGSSSARKNCGVRDKMLAYLHYQEQNEKRLVVCLRQMFKNINVKNLTVYNTS